MLTWPRWYFNLLITPEPRLGILDHITTTTTTTTVCLKSKRQNISISLKERLKGLKEMHSLALALFLVPVLIDSSSLCRVFAYTNLIFFLFSSFNFLYFTSKVFSNHNFMCKNFQFLYEKCLNDRGVWKYFKVEMTFKKTASQA